MDIKPMNIHNLRSVIKFIPYVNDIASGREFIFTLKIKDILPTTNFQLLGEQLIVGKDNTVGKCDLWLANIPGNFLLSLELKVGDSGDVKKRKFLQKQVLKYTDYMRHYFPYDNVYGMGAYKSGQDVKICTYSPLVERTTPMITTELNILKSKLRVV